MSTALLEFFHVRVVVSCVYALAGIITDIT